MDNGGLRPCSHDWEESKDVLRIDRSLGILVKSPLSQKLAIGHSSTRTRGSTEEHGALAAHCANWQRLLVTGCGVNTEQVELFGPFGPLGLVPLSTVQSAYPLQEVSTTSRLALCILKLVGIEVRGAFTVPLGRIGTFTG